MSELEMHLWIVSTGALCAVAAAIPGTFLVLRRMSLMGDAISHAVLPGLVLAFLLAGSRNAVAMFVGAAAVTASELTPAAPALAALVRTLRRVQHELFNLGSILATTPERVHPRQARITEEDVAALERDIDSANAVLEPLRSFVLPGGSRLSVELHICRTVCRRAERLLVAAARQERIDPVNLRYLNRLSDALFVWSRWANVQLGVPEVLWSPNESASAQSQGAR